MGVGTFIVGEEWRMPLTITDAAISDWFNTITPLFDEITTIPLVVWWLLPLKPLLLVVGNVMVILKVSYILNLIV